MPSPAVIQIPNPFAHPSWPNLNIQARTRMLFACLALPHHACNCSIPWFNGCANQLLEMTLQKHECIDSFSDLHTKLLATLQDEDPADMSLKVREGARQVLTICDFLAGCEEATLVCKSAGGYVKQFFSLCSADANRFSKEALMSQQREEI